MTIFVAFPFGSFCKTEKSVVPSVAGTTTSPSMMAEPWIPAQRDGTGPPLNYAPKSGRRASIVEAARFSHKVCELLHVEGEPVSVWCRVTLRTGPT